MKQTRADTKLTYAAIHLTELRDYRRIRSNDDWERAHQESCLYHLAGAVESLLVDVNAGYALSVSPQKVGWTSIAKAVGKSSPAFTHLALLKDSSNGWLGLLFELRNHGTHRGNVGKMVYMFRGDNEFKDPRTGKSQTVYPGMGCQQLLERLHQDVRDLLGHCRAIDSRIVPV